MMKATLLTAGAVLISLVTLAAPAEARRHRAVQAEQTDWSEEQQDERPARRSRQARVEDSNSDEVAEERMTRRSHRARARAAEAAEVASNDSAEERPSRRRRNRDSGEDSGPSESVAGVGPRPGAWCGWYMRTRHGGSADYNLAWNWSRRGSHLSGPQVGAIVVWPHHVGEITGQSSDGKWIVLSGNDSGQVKERARSVSGAVFRSL